MDFYNIKKAESRNDFDNEELFNAQDGEKSNAVRFINAYNTIDQTLRSIYNFKRNMTFSDMIRSAVSLNSVVRRYEDKLVDYARLRNAIIHNSGEDYVIAEPHPQVVEEMERIALLVSQPPKVINCLTKKNILTVDAQVSLAKVVELFGTSGFKAFPVYEKGRIIGSASSARVISSIGLALHDKKDIVKYLENTQIKDILQANDINVYYCVRSENLTVQEAMNLFFHNRKLSAIIITKNGNTNEPITSLVTTSDIIDLNKVVEDYE